MRKNQVVYGKSEDGIRILYSGSNNRIACTLPFAGRKGESFYREVWLGTVCTERYEKKTLNDSWECIFNEKNNLQKDIRETMNRLEDLKRALAYIEKLEAVEDEENS